MFNRLFAVFCVLTILLLADQADAVHSKQQYPCYIIHKDHEAIGQEIGDSYISFLENYGNDAFEKCNKNKRCKGFNSYGVLKRSVKKTLWEGVHLWVKVKGFEKCVTESSKQIQELLKYKIERKKR